MSLSLVFHTASAVGLLVMIWLWARSRVQIALLRRWASPGFAGALVGEPFRVLKSFCDAYQIPFEGSGAAKSPITKTSLANLVRLHFECQIVGVFWGPTENDPLRFIIRKSSATMVEDQLQIERDFANSFRVEIVEAS